MAGEIISEHIILNGRVLLKASATISVLNSALFYSFGVYESIEVDAGVPFHLDDHLDRLFHSAQIIEMPLPYTQAQLRAWVEHLIRLDHITESLLRIVAFGPNGEDEALVYILPMVLPHYPTTFYTLGATAITYPGCRPLPQAKTLNTLVNYLALRKARQAGAHEAFLVNDAGQMTEGSRSNIFAVVDGVLTTPPAYQVLSGITRDLVLKLAEKRGIPILERPLPLSELPRFAEMFVTSTSMHVVPIVRVDDTPINGGRIGPITRTLMGDFESYYAQVIGRMAIPLLSLK
jgi:branched-chain amino acid aminotransferase